jgi:hypothetical protein
MRYAIQVILTAMTLNLKQMVMPFTGEPLKGRARVA